MKRLCGTLVVLIGTNAFAFKLVSFNGEFTRWKETQIHYVLDSRGSRDFHGHVSTGCDDAGACKTIEEIAQASFQTWSNVPGAHIQFVQDSNEKFNKTGNDGKNTIVWVEKNWVQQSYSPPEQALAVTITTYKTSDSSIVDSDIHFNGEFFSWADINSPEEEFADVIDVQNILTHEIGHFFGLDHSSEDIFEPVAKLYLATMFFASGPGEIFRRNVGEDDMAAAANLYPANDPSDPVVDSITPNVIDVSQTPSATVQIRGQNFGTYATALLAVPGDNGDVVAQPVTAGSNELNVVFNFARIPSGKYDLVVANAFDRAVRVKDGLIVTDSTGGSGYDQSDGYSTQSGGCQVKNQNTLSGVFLLIFPVLLIAASRVKFAFKKQKAVSDAVMGENLRRRRLV